MSSPFQTFDEKLYRDLRRAELKKMSRLIKAGYFDLLDQVLDNEIDIDTAMQIFGGKRP
jgi:hypothetical protein